MDICRIFYFFLYGPLLMLTFLSFNSSEIVGFPFVGFSFKWYNLVFESPELIKVLFNSICVISYCFYFKILALLLAMGFRHDFPGKQLICYFSANNYTWNNRWHCFVNFLWIFRNTSFIMVNCINCSCKLGATFRFSKVYIQGYTVKIIFEEAAMDLGAKPYFF